MVVDMSNAIFLGFFKSVDGRLMVYQDHKNGNQMKQKIRLQLANTEFN